MAGGGNMFYKDVLPFAAIVGVECAFVGLNTSFKAATQKGMSYYVFVAYGYAVASLVLLPLTFIFQRTEIPALTLPILSRVFLLGLLGAASQLIGYKGIEYSSPTLASAISNLTPAFTFILVIVFRIEKLALRSSSTRAKIVGTALSILGAVVVVLYKGPEILSPSTLLRWSLSSSQTNWIIGGILLAVEYLLVSFWYIVQAQLMKMYPAEIALVFFYNLCATFICAPICFIAENNRNAWRIRPDIELIPIVYSGCVGTCFGTIIHTWGIHLKGPLYISMFKPLSIVIAVVMGIIFLGDALYLGSVVGAVVLSSGFYAVLWGQANEELINRLALESSLGQSFPLLKEQLEA